MQKTNNYNLNKPEVTDPMRLADFNQNSDLVDAALANLNTAVSNAGNCSIECGTYTGTGENGADNPNTLMFSIEPKIVFIFNTSLYGAMANTSHSCGAAGNTNQVFYHGGSTVRTYFAGVGEGTINYTLSGNTLTWYTTQGNSMQMNSSGTTYGYIAIG